MSYTLGIDTSSTDLGIGLYHDDLPIASYSRYPGNSHAEHITPVITMMLSVNGVPPDAIDGIAVAAGPGSFTGLRIGIAFVKGFCIGTSIRVLSLSSLQILAHAGIHHAGRIISAIDARNDHLFWAAFTASGNRINRLTDDTLHPLERFITQLSSDDLIITDTMGFKKSTVFSSLPSHCSVIAIERHPIQRGLICAGTGASLVKQDKRWIEATELTPNYLRRSTPEERLAEERKKQ